MFILIGMCRNSYIQTCTYIYTYAQPLIDSRRTIYNHFLFISFCFFPVPCADGEILRVLVNSSAQIKCDVGSSLPDDKVLLVVWYKNNLPIYR